MCSPDAKSKAELIQFIVYLNQGRGFFWFILLNFVTNDSKIFVDIATAAKD